MHHLNIVPIQIMDESSIVSWGVAPWSRSPIILRSRFPVNGSECWLTLQNNDAVHVQGRFMELGYYLPVLSRKCYVCSLGRRVVWAFRRGQPKIGYAVGTAEANDPFDGTMFFESQWSECGQIEFLSFRKGRDNESDVMENHCSDMEGRYNWRLGTCLTFNSESLSECLGP